jgi:hypothetical protein
MHDARRPRDAAAFRRSLVLDLAGVSLLVGIALRSHRAARARTGFDAVALVAAGGVAFAVGASPRVGRSPRVAERLVLLGAVGNTVGSLAVAAANRRRPRVLLAAVGLLVGGDLVSASYLRALGGVGASEGGGCTRKTPL